MPVPATPMTTSPVVSLALSSLSSLFSPKRRHGRSFWKTNSRKQQRLSEQDDCVYKVRRAHQKQCRAFQDSGPPGATKNE